MSVQEHFSQRFHVECVHVWKTWIIVYRVESAPVDNISKIVILKHIVVFFKYPILFLFYELLQRQEVHPLVPQSPKTPVVEQVVCPPLSSSNGFLSLLLSHFYGLVNL